MNVMNSIHAISIARCKINITPKWRFISRYKEEKILKTEINKFLQHDIFDASNNFISFLLSINSQCLFGVIDEDVIIKKDYLKMQVESDNGIIELEYFPKSNKFQITDRYLNVVYSIYRNSTCSRKINILWLPLQELLKLKYCDIILAIADKMS